MITHDQELSQKQSHQTDGSHQLIAGHFVYLLIPLRTDNKNANPGPNHCSASITVIVSLTLQLPPPRNHRTRIGRFDYSQNWDLIRSRLFESQKRIFLPQLIKFKFPATILKVPRTVPWFFTCSRSLALAACMNLPWELPQFGTFKPEKAQHVLRSIPLTYPPSL